MYDVGVTIVCCLFKLDVYVWCRCDYCDYKTYDRSALRRHEWRHRAVKPFSCKYCDFSCIQRPQIHAHYKNKHAVQPDEAAKLVQ